MQRAHTQTESFPAVPALGGWLLVYLVALGIGLFHGLALTVASIIIYANPSVAGLQSFVPLGSLLIYVATNLILAVYTVALFRLVIKRRRSAIVHNAICNLLPIPFLIAWHFLGEKSGFGTVVDILPGVAGVVYFAFSRRVRSTLVN